MAVELIGYQFSATAGESLTGAQFLGLQFSDDMTVIKLVTGATGAAPCGVLQNNPYNGNGAEIMVNGLTKVVQGVSVAAGGLIAFNDGGVVTGAGASYYQVGQMADNAGASGGIGSALISCFSPIKL